MSNMGVLKGDKESLAVTDGTTEKADAGMGSELSEALSEGKSLSDLEIMREVLNRLRRIMNKTPGSNADTVIMLSDAMIRVYSSMYRPE